MTVYAMTSLAGAPGVTTAATALAVHWPRPVVLIEADTSAASTIMAGFFRLNLRPTAGGIERLSFAIARNALEAEDLLDPELSLSIAVHELPELRDYPIPSIPEGHRMWVIPGFASLSMVGGVQGLWRTLPLLLGALGAGGIDVIVDLGRLGIDDPRLALIDSADRVIINAEASVVDLTRSYRRLDLPDLNQRVAAGTTSERFWALLKASSHEKFRTSEFSDHVLPVLATLPHDPLGAAVFSHGRPDPKPARKPSRGPARRVVQDLQLLHARNQDRSVTA